MKRMMLKLVMSAIAVVMLAGCGLIKSDKRSLDLQGKRYEELLSNRKFSTAERMYHKKFVWQKGAKKYGKTGMPAIKAFHHSIKSINAFSSLFIQVDDINKLNDSKWIVKGFIQVRQQTSASMRSVRWQVTITWIKTGDGWRILEIKELGERENFNS